MPSLMWECACGADNPAAAHSCTTCGRVPGLAPDPVQEERATAKVGRRRGLPFSAASGRRSSGVRERAIDRPPAGAPGPDRSLLSEANVASSEPFPVSAAMAESAAVQVAPGREEGPQPEPAFTSVAGSAPEPATGSQADAAAEPAKRKPSFFDPEPEPVPATAAQRRRRLVTPTAVAALVAIVIALGLLGYVIANTGNSKPPPQAGIGAPTALVMTA